MLHDDKERFTNTIYQTVVLTSHIAIRARKYDAIINDFISKNPLSMVVNLGCGFDTRYWRIDHQLKTFSERFYHSQMVLEVVTENKLIEVFTYIFKKRLSFNLEYKRSSSDILNLYAILRK